MSALPSEPDPVFEPVQAETEIYRRRMPDGRLLIVFHITFGRARIGIGDDYSFNDVW